MKTAETTPITPLTPAKNVLEFIDSHAGLFETCSTFPDLLAEYAPQLTIPGFGGELESQIEAAFCKSPGDEEWSLRREDFAERPADTAYSYFHGGIFGPQVSPYEDADHVFWILSSASCWLPQPVRSVLLEGMRQHPAWLWHSPGGRAFSEALFSAKGLSFRWDAAVEQDVRDRIRQTIALLRLSDTEDQLFNRFRAEKFPEAYLKAIKQRERNQRRRGRSRQLD